MGKKSALALMIIGGVFFFFIGLPVTAYLVLYSPQQGYSASSLVLSFLVSTILFIFIPYWIMKKGLSSYRATVKREKDKQEYETQLEKERRELELEKVRHERERIAKGVADVEKTPVSREREIIREVVKIRCRYCGKLHDERSEKCPFCGASN